MGTVVRQQAVGAVPSALGSPRSGWRRRRSGRHRTGSGLRCYRCATRCSSACRTSRCAVDARRTGRPPCRYARLSGSPGRLRGQLDRGQGLAIAPVLVVKSTRKVCFARVEDAQPKPPHFAGVDVVARSVRVERTGVAEVVDGRTQLAVGHFDAEVQRWREGLFEAQGHFVLVGRLEVVAATLSGSFFWPVLAVRRERLVSIASGRLAGRWLSMPV